jgi:hypothetical protein
LYKGTKDHQVWRENALKGKVHNDPRAGIEEECCRMEGRINDSLAKDAEVSSRGLTLGIIP